MSSWKRKTKIVLEAIAPRWVHRVTLSRASRTEEEVRLLPALCTTEGTAIDVGAHEGLYVRRLLPLVHDVRAFEPVPALQRKLAKFYGDRITLEPVALSDVDGKAIIRLPRGAAGLATLAPTNPGSAGDFTTSVEIDTRRLDDYELSRVVFIKIDVEGHEEAVLDGARRVIERDRPSLIIEVENRHNHGSVGRVRARMYEAGYEGFFLDAGELRTLSDFSEELDQDVSHVSDAGKVGRYINNFIYVPHERAESFKAAASLLL